MRVRPVSPQFSTMVSVPRLQQAFCCFTLETGASIIACVGVLFSLAKLCLFTLFYNRLKDAILETYNVTSTDGLAAYEKTVEEYDIVASIVFSLLIISVFVNGCLLLGVCNRNACLMKPWLIITATCITVIFVWSFLLVLVRHTPEQLISFLITVLTQSVPIHLYLIVHSLYLDIKEQAKVTKTGFKNFS